MLINDRVHCNLVVALGCMRVVRVYSKSVIFTRIFA